MAVCASTCWTRLRGPAAGLISFETALLRRPVTVIAQMRGVPAADRHRLQEWSSAFGRVISGRVLSAREASATRDGIAAFIDYFRDPIEERRRRPRNDMLSDVGAVEEAGDRLSTQEPIMNLILLLVAGHGTTTHLLGNGLLAVLRHPEQWKRLVTDETIPHPR